MKVGLFSGVCPSCDKGLQLRQRDGNVIRSTKRGHIKCLRASCPKCGHKVLAYPLAEPGT